MSDDGSTRDPRPSEEPLSYSEKYAGTPFGRPIAEPVGPSPAPAVKARRGRGLLGCSVILIGLYWLIPGVIGLISNLNVWYSGRLFDRPLPAEVERMVGTALVISTVFSVAWILIGLKIIIRPGRWSLGCSGIVAFVGAALAIIGVAAITDPPTVVLVFVGAYVTVSVVFALVALTASQVVD